MKHKQIIKLLTKKKNSESKYDDIMNILKKWEAALGKGKPLRLKPFKDLGK